MKSNSGTNDSLENTNADGSAPSIHFIKNSSSPAVGDFGILYYTGDNTVFGSQICRLLTEATNVTNGAEDKQIYI